VCLFRHRGVLKIQVSCTAPKLECTHNTGKVGGIQESDKKGGHMPASLYTEYGDYFTGFKSAIANSKEEIGWPIV